MKDARTGYLLGGGLGGGVAQDEGGVGEDALQGLGFGGGAGEAGVFGAAEVAGAELGRTLGPRLRGDDVETGVGDDQGGTARGLGAVEVEKIAAASQIVDGVTLEEEGAAFVYQGAERNQVESALGGYI